MPIRPATQTPVIVPELAKQLRRRALRPQDELAAYDAELARNLKRLTPNELTSTFDDNHTTLLASAAHAENAPVTQLILERGGDVNGADTDGYRPIHEAVETPSDDGQLSKTLVELVEAGADLNAKTRRSQEPEVFGDTIRATGGGLTPIDLAVRQVPGRVADARYLLSKGANVQGDTHFLEGTILNALHSTDTRTDWKALLRDGIEKFGPSHSWDWLGSSNGTKEAAQTMLEYAVKTPYSTGEFLVDLRAPEHFEERFAKGDSTEVLKVLLDGKVGLDSNKAVILRMMQLANSHDDSAATKDMTEGLRALVRAGVPNDAVQDFTGVKESALQYGVRSGVPAAANAVLFEGATAPALNRTNADNETDLMVASRRSFNEREEKVALGNIKLLLQHGANPNVVGKDGETGLHSAARVGFAEALNAQITSTKFERATLTLRNAAGNSPLDVAAENSNDAVVELLKHGLKADDKVLKTALSRGRSAEAVEALLNHGANANASFHPVHLVDSDELKTLDVLLKHGANIDDESDDGHTRLSSTLEDITPADVEGGHYRLGGDAAVYETPQSVLARFSRSWNFAAELLERGASPTHQSSRADSTTIAARSVENTELVVRQLKVDHSFATKATASAARRYLVALKASLGAGANARQIDALTQKLDRLIGK